jgi:hypothetical protein
MIAAGFGSHMGNVGWDVDRDARTRVEDPRIARLIYDPDDISSNLANDRHRGKLLYTAKVQLIR